MTNKPAPSPAMKIELIDPAKLVPYERNNKKHPDDQIERLAAIILSQGFDQPIVVDRDMVIIKGHGRRLGAIKAGLKAVPVIVRRDLTKEQAAAARISDNISVSLKYDTEMMQEELNRLLKDNDFGLDAASMGLSQKEIDLFLGDLQVANIEALMTDTHAEVETQKNADIARVAEADAEQVKLQDAFGFKTCSAAEQRVIARMVAYAQDVMEISDEREALIAFFGQVMAK